MFLRSIIGLSKGLFRSVENLRKRVKSATGSGIGIGNDSSSSEISASRVRQAAPSISRTSRNDIFSGSHWGWGHTRRHTRHVSPARTRVNWGVNCRIKPFVKSPSTDPASLPVRYSAHSWIPRIFIEESSTLSRRERKHARSMHRGRRMGIQTDDDIVVTGGVCSDEIKCANTLTDLFLIYFRNFYKHGIFFCGITSGSFGFNYS